MPDNSSLVALTRDALLLFEHGAPSFQILSHLDTLIAVLEEPNFKNYLNDFRTKATIAQDSELYWHHYMCAVFSIEELQSRVHQSRDIYALKPTVALLYAALEVMEREQADLQMGYAQIF